MAVVVNESLHINWVERFNVSAVAKAMAGHARFTVEEP